LNDWSWKPGGNIPRAILAVCTLIVLIGREIEVVAAGEPKRAGIQQMKSSGERVRLSTPRYRSATSMEEALLKRRSVREYSKSVLSLVEVSQLLWAAQGITGQNGSRTTPSAGALFPLEVYLVAGHVGGLSSGIYKYEPRGHELTLVMSGDKREDLYGATLEQESVRDGAAAIIIAAVYEPVTQKYGERGTRYVHMEAGHAAQNVYLQAVSLDLGTVVIGAFKDERIRKVLQMPSEESPLYIMPVGRK
jgi:SagB-type dehydrogenase family enzyme